MALDPADSSERARVSSRVTASSSTRKASISACAAASSAGDATGALRATSRSRRVASSAERALSSSPRTEASSPRDSALSPRALCASSRAVCSSARTASASAWASASSARSDSISASAVTLDARSAWIDARIACNSVRRRSLSARAASVSVRAPSAASRADCASACAAWASMCAASTCACAESTSVRAPSTAVSAACGSRACRDRGGAGRDDLGLRGGGGRGGGVALAGELLDATVAGLARRRRARLGLRAPLRLPIALGFDGGEPRERLRALGLLGFQAGHHALALGLLGRQPCERPLALGLRRLDLRQRALVLGDVLGLDARELRERLLAGGLDLRDPRSRALALGNRLGGRALGFFDTRAQLVRAFDEILEPRCLCSEVVRRAVVAEAQRLAPRLLGGRACGRALLGHAHADVLARERRRVGVADDDEDAGESRARGGLRAARADVLDGCECAVVAQPQRLGIPRVGVARAQLAEQRRELPAERERDADDDELQRAQRAVGGRRRERPGFARAAQDALEGGALPGIGGRREDLGDGVARELLGRAAEHRDDADATFGDRPVGGAQDVAAVGKGEQCLLDMGIGGYGRG